jgi:hypothetical protein
MKLDIFHLQTQALLGRACTTQLNLSTRSNNAMPWQPKRLYSKQSRYGTMVERVTSRRRNFAIRTYSPFWNGANDAAKRRFAIGIRSHPSLYKLSFQLGHQSWIASKCCHRFCWSPYIEQMITIEQSPLPPQRAKNLKYPTWRNVAETMPDIFLNDSLLHALSIVNCMSSKALLWLNWRIYLYALPLPKPDS